MERKDLPVRILLPHEKNLDIYGVGDPDVTDLLPSIATKGILRPLIVTPRDEETYWIVDGVRRWTAAVDLGLETVPCLIKHYESEDELVLDIIDYNRYRRKTPRQMYMEAMTLWPIFAEEARLRSLANLRNVAETIGGLPGGRRGRTAEIVGSFLGLSKATMERLKYIYDHEDEFPKIVARLDNGEISIRRAYEAMRRQEENEEVLRERKEAILSYIQEIKRSEVRELLLEKYQLLPLKEFRNIKLQDVVNEASFLLGQAIYSLIDIVRLIEDTVHSKYPLIDFRVAGKKEVEDKIYLIFEVPRIQFEELKPIKIPEERFRNLEEADEFAKQYGGYVLDLREISGKKYWFILVKPSLFTEEEGE